MSRQRCPRDQRRKLDRNGAYQEIASDNAMDRITRHLDYIPLPIVLLVAVAGLVGAIMFPKKYGLPFSLAVSAAWLNLNRFSRLGAISSVSKATFWLPLIAVTYFAVTQPGPKRKVPVLAWVYMIVPVLGCICVARAEDMALGFVQFATMFLAAMAAIAVYRVIDSEAALLQVMKMTFMGLLVPIAVSLIALAFFRSMSFIPGLGRFGPFGMIPNQLVPILAPAMCFGTCGFLILKSPLARIICVATIGCCFALLMATGSRQGVVVASIVVLPAFAWVTRRPILMMSAAVVAIGVAGWTFSYTEGVASTERLTDFTNTSGRFDMALHYLEAFRDRPVAGLLGTSGMSVLRDDTATHISHNSYLAMLYNGGLLLGFPLFLAMVSTVYSMGVVLVNRRRFTINPAILWSLAALMLAIYLQGLVSDMAYWSVSSWTFLHYFLSCLFMGLAREVKSYEFAGLGQYHRSPA